MAVELEDGRIVRIPKSRPEVIVACWLLEHPHEDHFTAGDEIVRALNGAGYVVAAAGAVDTSPPKSEAIDRALGAGREDG